MGLKMILYGNPITKKNSQRIVKCGRYHKVLPSKQFLVYEKDCLSQIKGKDKLGIDKPVNLSCLYYMQRRYKVDLVNLLEGTCDILVNAGVIADDNFKIIYSMDGSRVFHDKENPRVEIEISEIEE